MSARNAHDPARRLAPALYAGAALLAAAAGFAAVYVSLGPAGNVAPPLPAQQQSRPADAASGGPLSTLARGEVAGFVARAEPQALPDIGFNDGEGAARSLSDWRGKVVLLNLWATWCAPCREEMPALDRLKAAIDRPDFDVVAVSVDLGAADKPRAFLREVGIERLRLYHEPTARLGPKLKAIGMPTTLLIDREGRELGRLVGPAEWDSPDAQALVRAALDAQG